MAEVLPPTEEILLTHFIVSDDVERSRRFYTEVLGGKVVFRGTDTGPVNVKLSNSWIVINAGGGPTDDNLRSPWRRRPISTESAASSISGSRTSGPCTPNGAPGVLSS